MNQSEDTLLMATIGLAFVIEGVAQLAWGVDVRRLDLGIRDEPINWVMDNTGMLISQLDVTAAAVAGIMVVILALLFSHTKVGRGLRAVADDHAAALSIGIPLKHIWMLVWATAGVSPWSRACCGARAAAFSSHWCGSRSRRCRC